MMMNPDLTSAFRIISGSKWIVGKILKAAYGPTHPPITPALVAEWTDPFKVQGSEAAMEAMVHAWAGIPGLSASQLARIHVPAVVLWGSKDTLDPLTAGRATAAVLHAPFRELEGSGHLSMLVDPRGFANDVEVFAGRLGG